MPKANEKQLKTAATAEIDKGASTSSPFSESQYLTHLTMIQDVISRMADNSFKIKGLAITVAGAIWALNPQEMPIQLAVLITIMLWTLDAYYLHLEREFRNCYEEVRTNRKTLTDFKISPVKGKKCSSTFCMMFTRSVFPLYIGIIVLQARASLIEFYNFLLTVSK